MLTVCQGAKLDRNQLATIELKRPKGAGPVWQGIKHIDLVDAIHDQALFNGWRVTEETYSVSKQGTSLAGAIGLEIPDITAPEGQSFQMGFLTSNNMERSLRLVVGTRVAVCHNGMCTGQVVLRKKHTTGLDLAEALETGFTEYRKQAEDVRKIVASLQQAEIDTATAEHVLCEAGRRGIMCWSRVGDVDAEYRNPRFSDHGMGTSWALLNAFTWVVKRNPPLEQMSQINNFRALLPVATA